MHVTAMGDSNAQNVVPGADEEVISVDVHGVVRKFPSFSLDVSSPLCSHTQYVLSLFTKRNHEAELQWMSGLGTVFPLS